MTAPPVRGPSGRAVGRRWRRGLAIAGGTAAAAGLLAAAAARPDRILAVGAGLAAHVGCGLVFVSRQPVEPAASEVLRAMVGRAGRLIRYRVDRPRATVTASFVGLARRDARFVPGYGCRLADAANVPLASGASGASGASDVPPPTPVAAADPAVRAAIDRVFAESPGRPAKAVQAVVVLRAGRVVAERYAPGVGVTTPLPSWSVAKSLTNAIVGVLVRQQRLDVDRPVGAPEWAAAGDPRARITVAQLLRMTSGLDAAERGAPTDPVARMEFTARDMAHFAADRPLKATPGTTWEYTSANTLVLDRLLGRTIGGGAVGLRAFVARELAAPLHLTSLTLEVDGAGTFVGSSFAYATARDYARFGQLYLDDGVAPDGRRILPPGWVAWSRRATLGSAYGAGFWTNDGGSAPARARIAAGFPADGFYASGVLGQRIYLVPSARLVIVRLGHSMPPDYGLSDDLALIAAARGGPRAPTGSDAIPPCAAANLRRFCDCRDTLQ